jgi:hypothetical protein
MRNLAPLVATALTLSGCVSSTHPQIRIDGAGNFDENDVPLFCSAQSTPNSPEWQRCVKTKRAQAELFAHCYKTKPIPQMRECLLSGLGKQIHAGY